MLNAKTNHDLRDILRTDAALRDAAGQMLLDGDPTRLDLRYVIEFVDSLRDEAWCSLCNLQPTKFELVYVAAHVKELRQSAWERLQVFELTIDELRDIVDRNESLRDFGWTAILERHIAGDELPWAELPQDPILLESIWSRVVQFYGTAQLAENVCDLLIFHEYVLKNEKYVDWTPIECFRLLCLANCFFAESEQPSVSIHADDVAEMIELRKPGVWQEVLGSMSEPGYIGMLIQHAKSVREAACKKLLTLDCKLYELDPIIRYSDEIATQHEAWQRHLAQADPLCCSGIPFDEEIGVFRNQIWDDFVTRRPGGFLSLCNPVAFLYYVDRDWEAIQPKLKCWEKLEMIERVRNNDEFRFCFAERFSQMVKTAIEESQSIQDSIDLLRAMTKKRPSIWIEHGFTFEDVHNSKTIQDLVNGLILQYDSSTLLSVADGTEHSQLFWLLVNCCRELPNDVEARLCVRATSIEDLVLIACHAKSETNLQLLFEKITAISPPANILIQLLNSKLPPGPTWERFSQFAEPTELARIAKLHPNLATDAFLIACAKSMTDDELWEFVCRVPSVRNQAVLDYLERNAHEPKDRNRITWIWKYVPEHSETAKSRMSFHWEDRYRHDKRDLSFVDYELIFVDIESQSNAREVGFTAPDQYDDYCVG